MSSKISLCFICDENYVMPTAVAITSVLVNKNSADLYDIYVVGENLSDASAAMFGKMETDTDRIILIKTDTRDRHKKYEMKNFHVTTADLLKFTLPDLLPADLEKVLYLDGDVIANKDIAPVFFENVDDVYAGAVKDYLVVSDAENDFRQRLHIKHKDYFNAGVLLLNMKKLREDNVPGLLFQYRNCHEDKYMDQDTFNVVLKENVKYLSFFYNFQYTSWIYDKQKLAAYYGIRTVKSRYEWIQDAFIIHFTWRKPWIYYDFFAADLWLHYYLLSPFKEVPLLRKSLNEEQNEKQGKEIARLNDKIKNLETVNRRMDKKNKDLENSLSFKIGRLMTYVPRKARDLIRHSDKGFVPPEKPKKEKDIL